MRTIFPKSHTLEVTRIRLKSKKLDPSISTPFKVIHISDIHYDVPPYVPRIFPELLEEVIKHTNAEHPDIVCITGTRLAVL
jgi:predicted MPP superfamily phosphohydrolase